MVPALFLAFIGTLSFPAVFIAGLLATLVSDSFWYFLGRYGLYRIKNYKFFKKHEKALEDVSEKFQHRFALAIIVSKFVYGTRIAAQIFSGMEKISYLRYVIANSIGVSLWLGALTLIGYFLQNSINAFQLTVFQGQLAFTMFFFGIVGAFLIINKYIWKRRSR